ncbi:hypothetical protein [Fictibacillus gelatini]|uniref:hypothetical protein n=1 Tax=Fictibacillus gelatini TaxID=225985 RepID=UPI00040EAA23|nr:hypothetical protein [Fictibacillus gelatini]
MSFLDDMLSKLTDVFLKMKESNIGKVFTIVADQLDDLQSTFDVMELWRDIDNAKGKVLDRIGEEILQEYRAGVSDEEYRLKLKTRIIVNYLADGDIETIIQLLQVYLGESLVSVQEGWTLKDGPFAGEPAMLFITVRGHDGPDVGIPFSELAKVMTGGVATQWKYILEREIAIQSQSNHYLYPFEKYAGNLITGDEIVSNDTAVFVSSIDLNSSFFSVLQDYPICGTFVAGEVI